MVHLTMDHGVSGCFGTRLAPNSFRRARATFSTWVKVLDVRQAGTTPLLLSSFSHGRFIIDPSVIRAPDVFCRRFLTSRARESSIWTGTTLFENVPKHDSSLTIGGNLSEHRARHHSQSTPSMFNRYGGLDSWPIACRRLFAFVTILSSDSPSRTTLLQSRHENNESRRDSSVMEGSHRSRRLSGRDTILAKVTLGWRARSLSCTSRPFRYLLPGIFSPYKNAANILFDIGLQP